MSIEKVDLFIFAGEKSADIHGERLLRALKAKLPELCIAGVGGPKMREVGMISILEMEQFQVMGFIDVFLALPSLIAKFYTVSKAIKRLQPQVIVTIDYPGFNLRLHRHLRKKGFSGTICHYICPSVWAWGKKRIPMMVDNLDLLLSILPFEKRLFSHTHLPVTYVGNPLVEKMQNYTYKPFSIPTDKQVIALFPGSRKKEIERNLPLQLKVCKHLTQFHIAISQSEERFAPLIMAIMRQEGCIPDTNVSLVSGAYSYELMRTAHCAIAKSGTVTLELALHRTPTVVTYGISALDLFIAKDVLHIRLPYYCLVNIIAGKEIFAELIGPHFTEKALLAHIQTLLKPEIYTKTIHGCEEVIALLGKHNAAQESADALKEFFI